jgi:hypothetical protein
MAANTDQIGRLIHLCGQAIKLAQGGNRTPEQIEELIQALQNFKEIPSAKPKYPGRNGNRCNECGGTIDEGGICNCGWDHFNQIPIR